MTVISHHALPAGTKIGSYEVQSVLGIGGFGITYKAYDRTLERLVAVKEYLPSSLAVRTLDRTTVAPRSEGDVHDYEFGLKRFLEEARTLARFLEPSIVRVITYLEAHGTAYFVMDYEDGECLDTYLKSEVTLSEERIRDIAIPLLHGLRTVHAHNFLHRDIKPLNIYLRRSGSPVLLDFGAARQSLGEQSRAMTGMVTPGYAPFEQYLSDGRQGPWSDIYAMGATLYQCAVGVAPVVATERIAALHAGSPDPVAGQADLLKRKHRSEFVDTILWMLGAMPEDRPQSVDEVLAVLQGKACPPPAGARCDSTSPASPRVHPGANPRALDIELDDSLPSTLAPETLAAIEQNLQQHIGPLSKVLVRKVSAQASNIEMLTEMLSRFIDSEPARNTFLSVSHALVTQASRARGAAVSSNATAGRLDPGLVAAAEAQLTGYLGPVARLLVKKAAARSADDQAFYELLARELKDPGERAAFLRAVTRH